VFDHVETQVSAWVEWLRLRVEAPGALVIGGTGRTSPRQGSRRSVPEARQALMKASRSSLRRCLWVVGRPCGAPS